MITSDDFKIEQYEVDKFVITLLTTDDVGIKYYYEDVAFDERSDDECYLNFGYQIVSGTPVNPDKFQKRIGDILVYLIEQMVKSNELVYANGTD